MRLVTNKGRQYYPIGYLKFGLHFKPVNSQTPIVDDYQPYKGHRRAIENWVFRIGSDETPTLFEMKATARVALAPIILASAKQALPTIAASYYPQHPYNNSTMTLSAKIPSGLGPVKFVVLPTNIGMNQLEGLAHAALNRLDQIHHDLDVDHQPAWVNSVNSIKGTPTAAAASQYYNVALRINGTPNDGAVSWTDVLSTLLASQVGQTTDQCRTRITTYFNSSILPLIQTQSTLVYTTDAAGNITKPLHVAPGRRRKGIPLRRRLKCNTCCQENNHTGKVFQRSINHYGLSADKFLHIYRRCHHKLPAEVRYVRLAAIALPNAWLNSIFNQLYQVLASLVRRLNVGLP